MFLWRFESWARRKTFESRRRIFRLRVSMQINPYIYVCVRVLGSKSKILHWEKKSTTTCYDFLGFLQCEIRIVPHTNVEHSGFWITQNHHKAKFVFWFFQFSTTTRCGNCKLSLCVPDGVWSRRDNKKIIKLN